MDAIEIFSPFDSQNPTDVVESNKLSFGIELEFNVIVLEDGERDPHPQDDRKVHGLIPAGSKISPQLGASILVGQFVRRKIASSLNQTFGQTQVHFTKANTPPQDFKALTAEQHRDGSLSKWIVQTDGSVAPPRDRDTFNYKFVPVEVCSPAFIYSDVAVSHAMRIVDHLTDTYRTNVNTSAGLHIHIGCQNAGFSLPHLRKICALIWTFETYFFYLVGEHRWNENHCEYLTKRSRLALAVAADNYGCDRNTILKQGLDKILAVTDHDKLISLMTRNGDRLGVNFQQLETADGKVKSAVSSGSEMSSDSDEGRLSPPARKGEEMENVEPTIHISKNTIEIRLHEGTLQSDEIYHWIQLWIGVVQFAHVTDSSNLEKWLYSHIDDNDESYDPIQLLSAMKLDHESWYYGIKTSARRSGGGEADLEKIRDLATIQWPAGTPARSQNLWTLSDS
ncbi:hypothetical protein BDZ45DRAFT_719456 [Acephala macrosclerotiorum]|nr:hypothetical protein BDZ45DRAFT_719456 [Acephala macrosclerotiorum]